MVGAVVHVTERVDLCTYVTCPVLRYHPAVVAQKAATVQVRPYGGRIHRHRPDPDRRLALDQFRAEAAEPSLARLRKAAG